MNHSGKISVIVRSHNDAGIIIRTMDALVRQDYPDFEILSLDDNSTDGTLEIISNYPSVKIIPPDSLPYNPPRTLNRAVLAASGDIVVFNNSDAVPLSDDYLSLLTLPLRDSTVGATFGNQHCRPNAAIWVKKDYQRAFGDGIEAAKWRHFFSLVSSAARRDVLLAEPFNPAMQYSEDIEWSYRLKQKGMKIVYVPTAKVEHSHNYTLKEVRKRFYNEGWADAEIYGESPKAFDAFCQCAAECVRDVFYEVRLKAFAAIFPGIAYRITQKVSAFYGGRACLREKKQ